MQRTVTVLTVVLSAALPALVGCGGGGSSRRASSAAGISSTTSASNTAPVFSGQAPTTATAGVAYRYAPAASDPDGDPLTWSLLGAPAGMVLDPLTGAVEWTPQPGDVGLHPLSLLASDGQASAREDWTLQVVPAAGGVGQPLPTAAALSDLGAPPGGLPVISDLVEFDGRLWLIEALDPLARFGAQVWTYDDTGTFQLVLDDPTSQGYLRGRVLGGKLYVPDGDPDGLAPGTVYVFDAAAAAPRATAVLEAVHNFDVVELGGELYVTGGLDTGQSSLSRYDPLTDTWQVASRGAFSRLKYAAVQDGRVVAGKRSLGTTTADLVLADPATGLQQQGSTLLQGVEAFAPCVEALGPDVYVTLASSQGIVHVRLEPGGAVTTLTGLSGTVMLDFVRHSDGNVYAVGTDGTRSLVMGSTDGVDFVRLAEAADLRFGLVGNNADGRPSIASFRGKLFLGSSTTGRLYRLD